MVWSLSKDDDGLESVPGEAGPLFPSSLPGRQAPSPSRPHFSVRSALTPRPPVDGSSVVVDPLSQIPEPVRAQRGQVRKRPVEATVVLKGRQLDTLRQEAESLRRKSELRQKRGVFLWGLGGAGAVVLGAVLASQLAAAPEDTAQTPEEADAMPAEAAPAAAAPAPAAPAAVAPVDSSAPRAASPEEPASPTEVAARAPAPPSGTKKAVSPQDESPASNKSGKPSSDTVAWDALGADETEALSLDDLLED